MDLWIRSQEGVLGKPLFIRPAGLSLHIKWEGDLETFEHYESKQRALEVLDEIQTEISNYVGTMAQIVYQMPID